MRYSKEQQEWIDSRPKAVQEVIKICPPMQCFRGQEGNGHYVIHSYEECEDGSITLKINHLDDSFLPGVQVFGVDPKSLKICGCSNN